MNEEERLSETDLRCCNWAGACKPTATVSLPRRR